MFPLYSNLLSVESKAHHQASLMKKGFTTYERFVPLDFLDLLEKECIELSMSGNDESRLCGVVRDSMEQILVMNNLDKESDFLYDLARSNELMELAQSLIGKPPVPLHVEYFVKPRVGSTATPPHQDQIFYEDHFSDELAISFWIALDPATSESGALEFSEYITRKVLPHKRSPSIDFDYELINEPFEGYKVAEVPRGGCIVHHAYAIHRARQNYSDKQRRALVFNYRGSEYRSRVIL